jgi:hypothetical protein
MAAGLARKLGASRYFVPILSTRYYESIWCVQESGIAAFRNITFIPLAIEGSIPQDFFNHIQSTRIDPEKPPLEPLLAGIAKRDTPFVIDTLIVRLSASGSYRTAEASFELIWPYLNKATNERLRDVLNASANNDQIYVASKCATHHLPPLIKSHGHLLDPNVRKKPEEDVARNTNPPPPVVVRRW